MQKEPILAVVLPCYNEEEVLFETHKVLSQHLENMIKDKQIHKDSYLCFVDDGSKDRTWEILSGFASSRHFEPQGENANNFGQTALHVEPPRYFEQSEKSTQNNIDTSLNAQYDDKTTCHVEQSETSSSINLESSQSNIDASFSTQHDGKITTIAIKLSKNYGHQAALLAGLEFVSEKCDCALSVDCDLQDDVRAFGDFIKAYKSGAEVVLGVRTSRQTDSFFKKYSALGFYRLMNLLGANITYNHADYRLLSRRAIKQLLSFKERHLFLRGIVHLLGLNQRIVHYQCMERFAGTSKYPLKKMLSFAWNGITSFSTKPLRAVSMIGFCLFAFSILLGLYVLGVKLVDKSVAIGWASTMLPLCFFSGVQLLSLGVIGEYVGKIYEEVKDRPRYFVERIAGNINGSRLESGADSGFTFANGREGDFANFTMGQVENASISDFATTNKAIKINTKINTDKINNSQKRNNSLEGGGGYNSLFSSVKNYFSCHFERGEKSLRYFADAQYDERDIRHFEPPRHFEQSEKSTQNNLDASFSTQHDKRETQYDIRQIKKSPKAVEYAA